MNTELFKLGQQAYERGCSFILDNPFFAWDKQHYDWAEGYFERKDHYDAISKLEIKKEDEELAKKYAEEQEIKIKELKFKKSKQYKLEQNGQRPLF
jgi:hypothetical protein